MNHIRSINYIIFNVNLINPNWNLQNLSILRLGSVDIKFKGVQQSIIIINNNIIILYWNYRHQADVCHAYQILVQNGFNSSQIITFAYDDIAENLFNPHKGHLFNHPGNRPTDVYEGCLIDYKGDDVNSKNFLRVLRGEGSGKVLKSTINDNLFLYFADHGAEGLLAFPKGDYLYADQLLSTLKFLHANNRYSKMVFLIEACESGSMFQDLPNNLSIYAVSASSSNESSYAQYCPPFFNWVQGKSIWTCLADQFSVNWMKHISSNGETWSSLVDKTREGTTKSQVMVWGDRRFQDQLVNDFLSIDFHSTIEIELIEPINIQLESREIKLLFYLNLYSFNPTWINFIQLQNELQNNNLFKQIFSRINEQLQLDTQSQIEIDYVCLRQSIEYFEQHCLPFSDFGLQYIRTMNRLCQGDKERNYQIFTLTIHELCS